MTKWHIPTLWLVVSLIALILTIFIKCEKANEIKVNGYDAQDYKDSKDAIDYNDDFIEKYSTENYEDFNRWGDKRDRKHLSTVRNKNIGTGERKTRKNQRTIRFRARKMNGNNIKKTRKPLNTIKYTEKSLVTQNKNHFTRKYCVDVNNTLRGKIAFLFLFIRPTNIYVEL